MGALANALVPDDGRRGVLGSLSERAYGAAPSRLSLFGVRLDLNLNQAGGPSARQMLASRSAEGPFVLLVDEAYALSPEVGGRLLDALQSIRRMEAPFLLVLAGTPGIQQALRSMGTTFWERSLRRRGRDWTRIDRRLVVVRTHRFTGMADLFALVDAGLPEPFTTLDLARAMRSPRRLGQQAAFCFREADVSEICGKAGNTLFYRRAAKG